MSVSLAEAVAANPGCGAVGKFAAEGQGQPVKVTAVLERTAVIQVGRYPEDKQLVRHTTVVVDPAAIVWLEPSGLKASMASARRRGQALSLGRKGKVASNV